MGNSSIMIVEDERITALEIQRRLEKKGYSVSAVVASGAEAIEQARKTHPDLALMDIHLKGNMDGVQAAEILRECFDIPVIYISAYADQKTLKRAKLTGPFGYVLKPIDDRELNVTIEMALYKHKIERDLRQAELRYRTVADYTYDWEYWVDPEGNFIYVSPSCERITGYRPEDFMKDPDLLMSIIHPDDHDLLISYNQKKSETAEPSSLDFRIIDRSGKEHWIGHCCQAVYSKDRKYLGRRGSNRDITERKKAEEALQVEKNKLQAMIDAMNNGITIQNPDYEIIYQNQVVIDIFGCHIGEKCYRVYEGNDKVCDGCPVKMAFEDGKSHMTVREVVMPSGEIAFWENTANPIRDAQGKIISCIEITNNITERKQAEENIKAIFDSAPIGMMLANEDTKVVQLNHTVVEMTGKSADQLTGLQPGEILGCVNSYNDNGGCGKADACGDCPVRAGLTEVLKTAQPMHNAEVQMELSADGQTRKPWLSISVVPTTVDQRRHLVIAFADITERKKAEEDLKKTQESTQRFNEKLRVLHEVTNELTEAGSTDEVCRLAVELGHKKLGFPRIGIWLKGPDPEYTRGTFGIDEKGNVRDERDCYHKIEDKKRGPWKSVFYGHRELVITHDCQLHDALGKPVSKGSTKVSVRMWDGKDSIGVISIDDLLEPGAITDQQVMIIKSFASTVGHLYSQKCAEEEIESLAKFPSEDRSPVLRISVDGKLLYANPAAEPIIKNWGCQTGETVPDYWRKKVTEVLSSNTQKRVEYQNDDRVFAFLVVPVTEGGYVNLYGRDITERKQIEKRERQHQAEVAHAARLSTIGIMASTLAHELNQPLCAILTHAEGCLTISHHENPDTEKLRSKLSTVAKQAERAGAIISRIRGFARKGEARKSTINLNEVIREVVSFIQAQVERAKILIELDLDEGIHSVPANRLQIEQVIFNLVQNGVDAMQNAELANRKLTITTSMTPDNTVEVAIRDSGKGIDEKNAEKIFQPFFTSKPKGLGLGLSISQSIVESHSGKLYVKENSDKGVAFCLVLPAIPEKA